MTSKVTIPGLSSRQVSIGKRSIFLSELGEGYPLFMLHGGGPGAAGLSNYARNIEALSKHFRVLVPDMPGYGKSSKGVNRADPFGDLANAMLELMDALGIESAHVVGNSYGGACALRMALEQPRRVSAMVLMGPGGIGTSRGLPMKGLNHLLDYYNGKGPSLEKMRTFIREYMVYDGSQVPESVIQERFQSSIDPEVIARPPLRRPTSLLGIWRMDFTRDRRLARCKTPTLLLWGADDQVIGVHRAPLLLKALENCDFYQFSKTGHWVQWERAEAFNAATASFLCQHTPAAQAA